MRLGSHDWLVNLVTTFPSHPSFLVAQRPAMIKYKAPIVHATIKKTNYLVLATVAPGGSSLSISLYYDLGIKQFCYSDEIF